MSKEIGIRQMKLIDDLVVHFINSEELFTRTLNSLNGYLSLSKKLKPFIHTIKSRLKDPAHLRDKLIRKAKEAKKQRLAFDINKENLFLKITDLVGIRIIHLHTKQIEYINKYLKEILEEQQCEIIEGPEAKTWDIESVAYFNSLNFQTVSSTNMYTSVHYSIKPSPTITCEIQVRTLMEEVWGEVDHTINYPNKTKSLSCREQIKALARATSSCSRLVDSIFSSHKDFEENQMPKTSNRSTKGINSQKTLSKETATVKPKLKKLISKGNKI